MSTSKSPAFVSAFVLALLAALVYIFVISGFVEVKTGLLFNDYFAPGNYTHLKFHQPKFVRMDGGGISTTIRSKNSTKPNAPIKDSDAKKPENNQRSAKSSTRPKMDGGGISTTMRSKVSTKPNVPIEDGNAKKPENNERSATSTTRPKIEIDYEKGHKELCKNSWQEEYTKIHHHLLKTNKFLIASCSSAGWGNRLRSILCAFHLAVITRRAIIFECDHPIPLDKYMPPRYVKWNYKVNKTGLSVRKGYGINLGEVKNLTDRIFFEKNLNYSVEYNPSLRGNFYIALANLLKYDIPVWPNIPQMLGCDFFYLFKKSDVLENRLKELKAELGFHDNIVLSIHIREGDSVFNHNKGDKRFKTNDALDLVFDCAKQIESKIQEKYNTTRIIWFLAADSEKMKTDVKAKYGEKVRFITGPIEHIGHPRSGNEDIGQFTMLLDFFLLQQSDFRLRTSPSTFDDAVDYLSLGIPNGGKMFNRRAFGCNMPISLM